jgi:hypothetical protein
MADNGNKKIAALAGLPINSSIILALQIIILKK